MGSYPDGGSSWGFSVSCRLTPPRFQGWAIFAAPAGRWFWLSVHSPLPARTSSQTPVGQKIQQTPLQEHISTKRHAFIWEQKSHNWQYHPFLSDKTYFSCSSKSQIPLWCEWPHRGVDLWILCSGRSRLSNAPCPIPLGAAVHMHLVRFKQQWESCSAALRMACLCALTGFRCGDGCSRGLWSEDRIRWRKTIRGVLWCNLRGVWGGQKAPAQIASLDGYGFRHVHTKQRAEGPRLRGAHAGHGSGLDPVSTRYWTLD